MLLQAELADYRVGNERVGGEDTGKQQRGHLGIAQEEDAHEIGGAERNCEREQTEDEELPLPLPNVGKVHLQASEEHDVEQAYPTKKLERRVALENVEAIASYYDAGKHHANDVWDAQP